MPKRNLLLGFFVAVLSFAPAQFASAQPSEVWKVCASPADNYDEIIAFCTHIIRAGNETSANLSIAYNNRGNALLNKKDHDGAIRDFDEAIRIDRRNAQAWTNRGETYQRKDNFEKAISDHTEAIRVDPNHKDAWFNRGIAYQNSGNRERAIADYRQALKVNPNDDDARRQLRKLGVNE